MNLLEKQIAEHPACVQQPSWFALVRDATASLNQLYQGIGRVHLDTPPLNRASTDGNPA